MASTVSPWQLGGLTVRELGRRVWNELSNDEILDRSAALSYYFLFALFPALLFLTALLGFLPVSGLWDRLMAYVNQMLPGDAGAMVQKTLGEVLSKQRTGLLSLGALTALWAASGAMVSVMTALNVAYDLDETRSWWKRRLVAIGLTIGFSFLLLVALVLLVFGGHLGALVANRMGLAGIFTVAWNVASILIAMVAVLSGIALVYFLAPAGKQRWQWVTPGSVVALVLWLAMSFALRAYVSYFGNYNATYGSIGGVILLMLWLYLTGVVLLLGAEVNAEIEHAAAHRGEPSAKAEGEHAAPADDEVPAPAVARPSPRDERDEVVAARYLLRQTRTLQREGWVPVLAVAAAGIVGWLMSHRPVGEVAREGAKALETGRQVAAAIAARERLRSERRSRAA
jgi:membrane protein